MFSSFFLSSRLSLASIIAASPHAVYVHLNSQLFKSVRALHASPESSAHVLLLAVPSKLGSDACDEIAIVLMIINFILSLGLPLEPIISMFVYVCQPNASPQDERLNL